MSRLRVLFVTGEYPPLRGGISDYVQLLREELREQDTPSIVLATTGSEGKGVSTVPGWSWSVINPVRKLVDIHGVDVVHIQYQTGAFNMHPAVNAMPLLIPALTGVPVVTTFHDLRAPYLFPKAGRLRPYLVLNMARNSGAVVVTNPQDEAELINNGFSSTKIPVGPSLPKPDQINPPVRDNTVGYFGFPSREKGIFSLIEAIGMIERCQRPALKIVGAHHPNFGAHDFPGSNEIETVARQREVTLKMTGYLPPQQASNELNTCQVIAFPYIAGASLRSSALIAALNIGRPVVVAVNRDRDDLSELNSMTQLISTATGDVRGFSTALQDAIEQCQSADSLPEQFQWQSIAHRHEKMYRSIVDGHRK